MSKPEAYSAGESLYQDNSKPANNHNGTQEPLSGSKKVKNRKHKHQSQAEGS
ncbi:small acid-soluble spore protein P [Paenibacillus sp. SYP-B3998]|uniref:Small acid-soluble spore protein P n=1 Tax=Paenibacillus sp. SYP-B3998 TaxID=2678564 RepID=A0A6G4A5K6_9BACL|nr:small acid-soluble spore protein P [Paenibacillus sp. SYP-B3998]NEW08927.1 small acid-soluble spore protein P [Paenibacillus sp. SYP-B3998]